MKKSTDDVRSLQQGAKSPQRLGLHVGKGENAGTSEPVRFDFPPDPFAGIQLRTIPGEQIQAQLTFVALDRLLDLSGFVHRMTIPDQKDGGFASHHQTVQKAANDIGIHPFLFDHEPHPATPIHGTDHVEVVSRTGALHHGCMPFDAPGRSRMIVAAKARFVCKPDLRFHLLGFLFDRGIILLNPLAHALRVLLIGLPQRLLGRDAQLCQKTAHRIGTQANPIFHVNQRADGIAGPQGKWKIILARVFADHGSIDPLDHVAFELTGAAASLLGIQGIPAASPEHGQPIVNRRSAEPESAHNHFRAFPALNPCDCSLTKIGQDIVLKLSAIQFFRGRSYTTYA
jgi:hypothetical protein